MTIDEIRSLLSKHKGKIRTLATISGVPAPTLYKIMATKRLADGTRVFLRSDIKTATAEAIIAGCKRMPDIEKLKIKREAK